MPHYEERLAHYEERLDTHSPTLGEVARELTVQLYAARALLEEYQGTLDPTDPFHHVGINKALAHAEKVGFSPFKRS